MCRQYAVYVLSLRYYSVTRNKMGNKSNNNSTHKDMADISKEPIKIREKKLANGNISLYLDIYRNGKRE